jgi:hypothetical protein
MRVRLAGCRVAAVCLALVCLGGPTKPFCRADEAALKQKSAPIHLGQQRGSVMVGHIINFVYRAVCMQYLNAMRRRHWA